MFKNKHNSRLLRTIMTSAMAVSGLLGGNIAAAEPVDLPSEQEAALFTYDPVAMDPLLTPAFQAPMAARSLLLDITRVGDRLIAVGEHGNIVYSDNGGEQWYQAAVPVSVNLTAVTFVGSQHGWAVGHHGVILKTEDGGATWAQLFNGMDAGEQVIKAAQAEYDAAEAALSAAGDDREQEAVLERWDMADLALGDAKASVEFGPAQPLMDVWFESPTVGLVVGSYGQIFRTTDGGQTWMLWKHGIDNPNNFHYYGITEAPNGDLYLVGEQGGIYRSTDRGQVWTALNSPYEGSLYGVVVASHSGSEVLLVYGFNGNVFRSTDAGETWQQINSPTRKSINDGVVLDDGTIVLVGNSGVMLRSTDGGQSFALQTDRLERPFVSVAALEDDTLALVGIAGARVIHLSEAKVL